MNEFLLKEIAYLLYKIERAKFPEEMPRDEYFKDLEVRYKKDREVNKNKRKKVSPIPGIDNREA